MSTPKIAVCFIYFATQIHLHCLLTIKKAHYISIHLIFRRSGQLSHLLVDVPHEILQNRSVDSFAYVYPVFFFFNLKMSSVSLFLQSSSAAFLSSKPKISQWALFANNLEDSSPFRQIGHCSLNTTLTWHAHSCWMLNRSKQCRFFMFSEQWQNSFLQAFLPLHFGTW